MKADLKLKTQIVGYSALRGVDYHRLKARAKKPTTSIHTETIDAIRSKDGEYFQEYRLVKEAEGFAWRNVLCDTGINGHHETVRKAISSTIWHVDIFIDEQFEHDYTTDFKKHERFHHHRECGCLHKNIVDVRGSTWCGDCGRMIFIKE